MRYCPKCNKGCGDMFCPRCHTLTVITEEKQKPTLSCNLDRTKSVNIDAIFSSGRESYNARSGNYNTSRQAHSRNAALPMHYAGQGSDPRNIHKMLREGKYSTISEFLLNIQAYDIQKISPIDELISMDVLRERIDAHPYQMKVALSVLNDMRMNAILADEVGLGKTIEAGIVLKELLSETTSDPS